MKCFNSSEKFIRTLNLFDAMAIVISGMIGSGIFIVSTGIAIEVKSASLLLLVWLISAIITVIGALCYGEHAACWPDAGGQYVYIKKIWGELTGFLYGWTLFFVIKSGSIAAVALAFAKFLSILFPFINSSKHILNFFGLTLSVQQFISILLIIILTITNTKKLKLTSIIQNIVTTTNIIALSIVILFGLIFGLKLKVLNINFSHPLVVPHLGSNMFLAFGIGLVGSLFALDGWNNLTFIAAEIKKPEKNLPLALLFGTGLVGLIYFVINILYLSVLPLNSIIAGNNSIIGTMFMQSIFGRIGEVIISIIILIATFGCINSMILGGARVLYAIAKDGLFFKSLAKLGEKSKTPEHSLLIQCIWSIILVISGSYSDLLDYIIFASLLFYILTVAGLFISRRKYPDIARPYKTFGYPYLPIIYCVLCTYIEISLLICKPLYSLIGLGIVFTGIPVYMLWKKLGKSFTHIEKEELIEF